MAVLTLKGAPINWENPPRATDIVMWSQRTTSGKRVTGSFRTIAALDKTNDLAKRKFGVGIVCFQPPFNTGVAASEGTHDGDAALDVWIPGVSGETQQSFFRANGWGGYFRTPAQGFMSHIHMFLLPRREGVDVSDDYASGGFKVGVLVDGGWSTQGSRVASSQIEDYYRHRNALASHASDPSWFPSDIESTIFALWDYVYRKATEQASLRLMKSTSKPKAQKLSWRGFLHLRARGPMNYKAAIQRAAKRPVKWRRAVDVDGRPDQEGGFWALHWDRINLNGLHDPTGKIKPHAKISGLTTAEVARLRYRDGSSPHTVASLLELASDLGVRVELELKDFVPAIKIRRILHRPKIAKMHRAGLLQWKTLAALDGASRRMKAAKRGGGTTLLSFTKYRGKGIPKAVWPYVDHVRGLPKWR